MAIVKIQHRRGDYNDYDPSKVLPGEMVVTLANDPNASDGRGVYIGTVSGHVKQLATVEDMEAEVATALDEAVPAAVSDATARAEEAAQSAAQSARTLTIDNTLTQHGQVPESYAAGQIVVVSDTQPSAVSNKMWLNPSSEEVEIPTAADLSTVTQSVNSLQQDVTELEGAIDDVQTNLTTEITKANDNVANEFRISINNTYPVGTYVIHEGVLYVCNTETSARSWDPAKWTRVRVMPQFSTLRKDITGDYAEVSGASTATVDFSMSFTHTYVFHNKGTGTITSVVARSAGGGSMYTVAENLAAGEKVEVVHPTGYETVVVTFGSQSTLAMYDKDTMRGELENEIYSIDIDVDDTLTEEGKAADAKATGDEITNLKQDLTEMPSVADTEETEADLYICDPSGNVIAKFVNGHIVTKNFDSGNTGTDLIMEADSNDADLYIVDTFGNVIAEFIDGHIVTKNFDSSDYIDVLSELSSLQIDVSALKSSTSGILYRTKAQTDGVYASCRWHQPNASSKQFCLLAAGDVHTDPTRMQSMIDYLNAIDAFDAGIMLGDMSGNTFSDSIAYYTDAIAQANKPFLTVIGNHDVGGATSDSDLWTKYGDCFQYADLASGEAVSGKCYYYKDFASYKVRIIVLMQYDYTYNGNLCFGQDQIDWFIDVLQNTPSDYGVIIAEHTNSSRYMTYHMGTDITSDTWRQSNYAPTVMNGDPIPDIVNAWVSGGTLAQTYSYTFENPPSDLSVNVDFTSRGTGEFISYLGGHWHMNVLGTPTSYTDQPDYHVPAIGLSAATQGDMPRKAGTVSEDSLNVISIDREKKTVKVYQIGAHYTKDAVDRQYFQYVYGGVQS